MNRAYEKSQVSIQETSDWQQRVYRIMNSEAFVAFLFLMIPVLFLTALKIYPVFYNLYLSFTRYELFEAPRWVGLRNYEYVFTNDVTRQSIGNTLLFTIEAVPLGTALALTIAKLLNQSIRGRVFLRTLYYLPVISSVVVSAMIWRWIYSPQNGFLNHFIGVLGLPPHNWLNGPNLSLIRLVIVTIWSSISTNMITFLAGLQGIPNDVL